MRSAFAAALFLPAILSAQALHSGVSHLVASVDAPAFAFQVAAVNAVAPHISTGLIAPIRQTQLKLIPSAVMPKTGDVTVAYTVDAAGVPQDVRVTKGLNDAANAQVVEAVKQVRYTPGTLNGKAVPVPVTLHVALTQ